MRNEESEEEEEEESDEEKVTEDAKPEKELKGRPRAN
ncbi:hypothetical protein C5167_013916 [Papaver somniferum]|uniref:Uncharacterized protein n=1 Tax=Papaver somniferum TaxID=3469 RepID=A0A4Y7J1M2_PAPSO|nr:hypothetical protein C5167_013916 [Papaver somniferum]